MNINETIAQYIEKHKAIIATNPEIKEIEWHIENIPYKEWEEWRTDYNKKNVKSDRDESKYLSQNNIGDRLYVMLHSWDLKIEKMRIDIYSVPVSFKHSYTAIEEIPKQQ